MNSMQTAGCIVLAVIGLLLVVISSVSRDGNYDGKLTPFADHLSKAGIFLGGAMMLPLLIILLTGIIMGFPQ